MANGKVVGGRYMTAMILLTPKGELALQVPLKFRKVPLNRETVLAWEELNTETRAGAAGAVGVVGQAVAGAVLPGLVGKMASAAIGSTVDTIRPARTLRIDWADGDQSLIQLPEKLFTHLAMVLKDRQALLAAPPPEPAARTQDSPQSMAVPAPPTSVPDLTEQIAKLAALRDQGVLTEDEFVAKKTELLARL